MFGPGDLVVVGVSGGPDSVALLRWLTEYAHERDVRLVVAHLNHELRGAESDEDARWVAELASRLGWPARVDAVDVMALKQQRRLSLEDAAREARYGFFADTLVQTGGSCVAVGHTADDQVETVVQHWLRGAGLPGLRGMLPVMRYGVPEVINGGLKTIKVVRPMLEVPRAEVEVYLRAQDLQPRLDRTNEETVFQRNRVRLRLIPHLESFNPRFKAAMLRLARISADDYAFIEASVKDAWRGLVRERNGELVFDLAGFVAQPASLQRYLLREAATHLVGDLEDIANVHVESAVGVITRGRTGSQVTWPRGLRIRKGYAVFTIGRQKPPAEPALSSAGQRLQVPGETLLVGTKWRVEALLQSGRCASDVSPFHADLDFEAVGPTLVVRRRLPGDRFQPLGMDGEKSLQDFLVDAKVPREERDDVPIAASPERIVWVAGLRIDARARVRPETRTVLHVRFVEED